MTQVDRPGSEHELDELLGYLRRSRNFDFTGYKRTSLMRRFQKRMREVKCATFADYQDYLEVHPEEYQPLFDILLINVTRFFRDLSPWQFVSDRIVNPLVQRTPVR